MGDVHKVASFIQKVLDLFLMIRHYGRWEVKFHPNRMKRSDVGMLFQWKSTRELLTGFGGLPIAGKILSQLPLINRLNASEVPDAARPGISHGDVVTSYLGLLAQGENDFDHIEDVRADRFFQSALNLERVPSSPTLRQRLDQAAAAEWDWRAHWGQAVQESSDACLRQFAHWQPLTIGGQSYIPLDVDVSPMDNSKTHKEGCSWTYKHFDGYAPNFCLPWARGLRPRHRLSRRQTPLSETCDTRVPGVMWLKPTRSEWRARVYRSMGLR